MAAQGDNIGSTSGGSDFGQIVGTGAPMPGSGITVNGLPTSGVAAEREIAQIASDRTIWRSSCNWLSRGSA